MKKKGVLNVRLAGLLASLGHKDCFMICDCGMPIPAGVEVVDLALCMGEIEFKKVFDQILDEVVIEGYTIAAEMKTQNKALYDHVGQALASLRPTEVSHERLKSLMRELRFVIRTGENTPYANVLLQSGVAFS